MSIPVERYLDQASLDEELQRIFGRFCFVAHESDLPEPDDYFSFRLGRHSLTLRRFDDRLSLFDNICRHRFNLIDPPGFGKRPFRCTYHGWTYGKAGNVAFIPLREQFSADPEPLKTHLHQSISGFVFATNETVQRALAIKIMLDQVGPPEGPSFHQGTLHHRCNWKLMVENVLEGYHLSVVHPNTFGKSGFTTTSRSEAMDGETDTLLITYPNDKFSAQLVSLFPNVVPSYRHLYVFPNLFVSVTNDLVYFVSNVFPISADETILHYRLFGTKRLNELKLSMQEHIKAEALKFTEATLIEDKEILERCQVGMLGAVGEYMLGGQEHRIRLFHETYSHWL
jgi:phenylpropionate dioxygenase-like ring-hydroxylating dioxygenase large terminal subunit